MTKKPKETPEQEPELEEAPKQAQPAKRAFFVPGIGEVEAARLDDVPAAVNGRTAPEDE